MKYKLLQITFYQHSEATTKLFDAVESLEEAKSLQEDHLKLANAYGKNCEFYITVV